MEKVAHEHVGPAIDTMTKWLIKCSLHSTV